MTAHLLDADSELAPDVAPDGPPTTLVAPPPSARRRGYGTGYWGMVNVVATEAIIFVGLLSSYFFLRASSPVWPQGGIPVPKLTPSWIFSILLWSSSVPVLWAESAIKHGNTRAVRIGLVLSFLLGAAFLGHEAYEWIHLEFPWDENAYTSIFYVTTGVHAAHVLVGLLMNVQVQTKTWLGRVTEERHTSLQVFGIYWHFVDVVWVFVFASLYLSEYAR